MLLFGNIYPSQTVCREAPSVLRLSQVPTPSVLGVQMEDKCVQRLHAQTHRAVYPHTPPSALSSLALASSRRPRYQPPLRPQPCCTCAAEEQPQIDTALLLFVHQLVIEVPQIRSTVCGGNSKAIQHVLVSVFQYVFKQQS